MSEIEYRSEEKERLDRFLSALFSSSREKAQKLISESKILVNNRLVKKNYLLKMGDKIEIFEEENKENELDKNNDFKIKLDIISETDDYLVLNKPAGLVVHPLKSLKEKTLVTALIDYFPTIKNVGDPAVAGLRPGIIHRLDKDVSGLLLVVKTRVAFDHFKKEFKKHRIQKEYLALVHGQPKKESGIISSALAKMGAKTVLAKNIKLDEIKESWTEYEVLEKFKDFTLLKIKIKTGRTHQIRIHLKSIGLPIVGDKKYKIKRQKVINLNRIFLHACRLGFYDLNNQWREYQVNLPDELKSFLTTL